MPSSPWWKIVTKPQHQHWQYCVNIFFNKCLKKKYQHCDLVFIKELILCKCILILLIFAHLDIKWWYLLLSLLQKAVTKSFMLLSASVNSISSIPSPKKILLTSFPSSLYIVQFCWPVYQCRKAFLRNIAVNCSEILLKISWNINYDNLMKGVIKFLKKESHWTGDTCMAVELPINVAAMGSPRGGTSQTATYSTWFSFRSRIQLILVLSQ